MADARMAHGGRARRRIRLRPPVLGTLTIAALIVMGAFAGSAQAAAVTGLTVDPLTPSAAGGARTDYVIHFSTSRTGALAAGQHITITLPTNTSVRTVINTSVTVGATQVGSCGIGSADNIEICTIFQGQSIAAGTAVTVELDGVTNPPASPAGAQQTLSVTTDTDTTTAQANYSVVAGGSVSQPTVTNSPPTSAAGGRTVYTIGFTTSSTGGMSGKAHSQITITFPGSTSMRSIINTSVNVGATQVGSCGIGSADNIEICTIFLASSVGPNAAVTVELDGVTTETPAPVKNADLLTVSTTSDTPTMTSGAFPVVPVNSVSQPTVTNSPPTSAAGGRTVYTIGFTTSSTGGMSGKAHSQITITFPGSTSMRSIINTSVNVGATQVGSCGIGSADNIEICTIFLASSVGPNAAVTVELDGVTTETPAPVKNADLLTVSTTSDTPSVTSGTFPVVPVNSVSQPTVTNSPPTSAAGGRTVYTIGFTTSSTGVMSGKAHSQITITFPGNTSMRTIINTSVNVGATQVGSCGIGSADNIEICTLFLASSIGPNAAVTVELDGVTTESPAPAGNTDTLTVSTTSDTPTTTSGTFPVVAAQLGLAARRCCSALHAGRTRQLHGLIHDVLDRRDVGQGAQPDHDHPAEHYERTHDHEHQRERRRDPSRKLRHRQRRQHRDLHAVPGQLHRSQHRRHRRARRRHQSLYSVRNANPIRADDVRHRHAYVTSRPAAATATATATAGDSARSVRRCAHDADQQRCISGGIGEPGGGRHPGVLPVRPRSEPARPGRLHHAV